MATYKVPQDVEAEDKIVGFLSLKQLIFVIVMFVSMYMCYLLGQINIILALLPLPITLVSGILGLYQRKDQPIEIFLASWIRFKTKSRKRMWDQEGFEERVIITVPYTAPHSYTKGFSAQEVSSHLRQLSAMMDTRGWASKQVYSQVQTVIGDDRQVALDDSQRLLSNVEIASYATRPSTNLDSDGDILKIADLYSPGAPGSAVEKVDADLKRAGQRQQKQTQEVVEQARSSGTKENLIPLSQLRNMSSAQPRSKPQATSYPNNTASSPKSASRVPEVAVTEGDETVLRIRH